MSTHRSPWTCALSVRRPAGATAARAAHERFRLPIDMARCYRTTNRTMEWSQATGGSAMSNAPDAIRNRGYHAHIYYDPDRTRPTAERLCDVIGQQFQVQFGGFRDEPVGPQPVANVPVIFAPEQFQAVVEWLMLHRDGLDVLIHPLTDNSLDDHSRYAMWLGSPVALKLDTLRRTYRPELLPGS